MKLIIFILIVLIIAALLIRIILRSVNQHSPLLMQLHAAGIRTGDAERILSAVWFFRTVFPVSVAAAMNPEHMAECDHRIMRSEFPDYRELFRESDIKSAVVDSIGQRNSYVKTWGCGGFLNETNIYSRGKSLCF
ncbi:hypothetical protein BvCmsOUP082_04432 [Escherichia coli]|nr:hypothetical protein BvCmsOUP082_04432 [Escherichia coli]